MPIIDVKKPFKIRLKDGEPVREFPAGDHDVSEEELENWFIKDAIKAGDIIVTDKAETTPSSDEPDDDPETTLNLVQRSELEATEAKLANETAAREQAETKLADEVTKREDAEAKFQAEESAHTLATNKLADETQARERAEDELAQEIAAHNETKAKLAALEAAAPAEEDLESKMLAVFPKLTDGDYKTDGTPKVKAVETLLGEDVTADQVAAAWTKFQEGQE